MRTTENKIKKFLEGSHVLGGKIVSLPYFLGFVARGEKEEFLELANLLEKNLPNLEIVYFTVSPQYLKIVPIPRGADPREVEP